MMKVHRIIGIVVSVILIIFGFVFPIPEKHLFVHYSYDDQTWLDEWGEEYVGGDAYNYQMEASLKAGWVSGVMAMKAICTSSGIILFFIMLTTHSQERVNSDMLFYLKQLYQTKIENEDADIKTPLK